MLQNFCYKHAEKLVIIYQQGYHLKFVGKNFNNSGNDWDAPQPVGQSKQKLQGGPKNVPLYFCSYPLPIIDQFSKFFHWHTLQTTIGNAVIMDPTTP